VTTPPPACGWHTTGDGIGYLAWHARAARSWRRGERQTRCPSCFRYFFPWERVPPVVLPGRDRAPAHPEGDLMYVRALRPGETLRTKRPVAAYDPINAQMYLAMGWTVLIMKDGCVVAMSEEPFDDPPPAHPEGDAT
jgi:hypothetical protein